jgi:pimeloyl-ACP methyl ester carboxylesterase
MNKVSSADGTAIAFDRLGEGPPVILVGGATCDRAMTQGTAEALARHCSVINYDRRGRGDSGDTAPYAVEREIEDLHALIAEAGGTASLYGHSSGAGLVLRAAAAGLPIDRCVLHEPPYVPAGGAEQREAREQGEELAALLAEGRRGEAMEFFLTLTGMPQEMVAQTRDSPRWAGLEALAPTLAYDSEIMGDVSRGGTIPYDLVARVTAPTLVIAGGASPGWMIDEAKRLAEALPRGSHLVLEGQGHVVDPDLLAPVLAQFFGG